MFVLNVFLPCSEVYFMVIDKIRASYETSFTKYFTHNYITVRYCDTLEHLIIDIFPHITISNRELAETTSKRKGTPQGSMTPIIDLALKMIFILLTQIFVGHYAGLNKVNKISLLSNRYTYYARFIE